MQRVLLKSKIHRATVTQADLNYEGSITIDRDLLVVADMCAYERVQVVNISNGQRFETYVVEGEAGNGEICLNGAAARLGQVGDLVIIMSYALFAEEACKDHKPAIVKVDAGNKVVR